MNIYKLKIVKYQFIAIKKKNIKFNLLIRNKLILYGKNLKIIIIILIKKK